MSTLPMRSETDSPRGSAATIGKSVSIKGQILSREDLVIDGEIEGSVEAPDHRVTVGPNGRVNAGIRAKEIVVVGSIIGNVEAVDKIDIRKEAKLVGDIKTARIMIEDGAYFKGSIDILKREAPKAQPVRAASAPASAPTLAPAPVPAQPVASASGKGGN